MSTMTDGGKSRSIRYGDMGRFQRTTFPGSRRGRGGGQVYRDSLHQVYVSNQRLDRGHRYRGRHRPRLRTNVWRVYYRNEHTQSTLRSAKANSDWNNSFREERDLERLESKEDSEIMFWLSGNLDYLKDIVRLSKTNEKINKMLLMVLEKGVRSESTPALMLTVINAVIEMEFIFHTVQSLKTYFENSSYNEITASDIESVLAVLRILVRIYSIHQNAITFVLGSYLYVSDLVETVRNILKVDALSQNCTCIQREKNNTSKITSLQTYSGRQDDHVTSSDRQKNILETCSDSQNNYLEVHSDCQHNNSGTSSKKQQNNLETFSDSHQNKPESFSNIQQNYHGSHSESQQNNPESHSDSEQNDSETCSDRQQNNRENHSDSEQNDSETCSDRQQNNRENHSKSRQYKPDTSSDSHPKNPESPSDSQQYNPKSRSDSLRDSPENQSDSLRNSPENQSDSLRDSPENQSDSLRNSPENQSDSLRNSPENQSDSLRNSPENQSDSLRNSPENQSDSLRNSPENQSDSLRDSPENQPDSLRNSPENQSDSLRNSPENQSDSLRNNPENQSDSLRNSPENQSDSLRNSPENQSDSLRDSPENQPDSLRNSPENQSDSLRNSPENQSDGRHISPECHSDIFQKNNETLTGFLENNSEIHSDCDQNYLETQSRSQQNNQGNHLDKEQNNLETKEEKNNEHLVGAVPYEEKDMSCSCAYPCPSKIAILFAQLEKHKQVCISRCSKRKKDHRKDFKREDFRKVPIFPRLGDLNGDIKPQLRVNKAKGGYRSVDDYLDVQFRLLRHDFVGPLRDGIFALKGQTCEKRKKQIQEIKGYENVRIESFVCGDGLNHVLRFDIRKMKHIRWNMTKRLKYGSLVCLSADDFKTCYFATIVNSDIKFRREGRVHVKFAHESNIIKGLVGLTFTMIESTAYFEAYRPVLASLQSITDLPFQEYLVKCNVKVLPPKYLRQPGANIFDLRCLLEPGAKIHNNTLLSDIWLSNDSTVHERVNILESEWPKEDMFQLDRSQLSAFKSALTKEFCVIQGPPGCGKTHIGLEITKVLLHNKCKWRHENGSPAQLLIVCYTNHALDQFMDGIRSFFMGNIVRIGSRCSNENLKQCSLKTIKNHFRQARKFPLDIYKMRVSAQRNVNSLKYDINLEYMKIRILKNNIIHERSLSEEMGIIYSQFIWLKQNKRNRRFPRWLSYLDSSGIVEWLGIIDMAEEIQRNTYFSKCVGHGSETRKSVDDLIFLESRETMTDAELDFDVHPEQSTELEIFKSDHISLDIDEISNVHWHLKTDAERKVIRRNRNALKEKVQHLLQETQPMSETEALSVRNIQSRSLTREKRWALYLFWVQKKCNELYLDTEDKLEQFKEASDILKEVNMMEERHICNNADVIGMTVTGAAIHKTVLLEVKPTIMIVEEAAEVFESQLISNLTPACQHLILIGDHKQLRPKPNMYKLGKDYNMDISLFERMIMNDFKCDCLQTQHRMRPQIADNVRHIYETLVDHDSVKQYKSIRGISQNIFFINHCVEEKKDEELKSYTNAHEVKYLVALCKYLLLQGYDASKITLLTTYKGQMFLLKKEMLKQGELLKDVKMTIVDDYQGEENDIILLSLVRSNNQGTVGFLVEDNRVCVALSRAKKGLYVIGNFTVFATVSPLWKSIVNGMKKKELMGSALTLCCQNHPSDVGIMAAKSTDFQSAPEGGCGKICDIRLTCGHACGKYCHVKNRNHTDIICKKPCAKRCKNGHPCRKLCWEQCYCEEEIIETLPRCGHIVICDCSADVEKFDCNVTCMRVLDCGHKCREKCSDPCVCKEQVTVTLPKCGHQATIYCFVNPNRYKCDEYIEILRTDCGHFEKVRCNATKDTYCERPCNLLLDCGHVCKAICGTQSSQQIMKGNSFSKCPAGHLISCDSVCKKTLQCGHICTGKCNSCFSGRWHQQCQQDCSCDLICGHKCKGKCGFCQPCTEKCTRRCSHYICKKPCIQVCRPCKRPCQWQCKHWRCNRLCGEICDRPRCDKPCLKSLPCKHKCIGMCGDPCPSLCRICNKDKVCDVRFGNENLPDARFVQLQDCGHIIKCDVMDLYMDSDEGLCVKRCPICKETITTTYGNRYENTINKINRKINEVKKFILQDSELYNTLDAIANKRDPVPCRSKESSSDRFIFFDCRGALSLLNIVRVEHFIESVSTENAYPLNNKEFFCPHTNMHMSSQKLLEIWRELTRYFDKCQVKKINKTLEAENRFDLKVKTIFEEVNKLLFEKTLYKEDDREKVQLLINDLPEIPNTSKKLLTLSLSLTEIDRDTIVKNRSIKTSSLHKWEEEASRSIEETANMKKKQGSSYRHGKLLTIEQEKISGELYKQNDSSDESCPQHTSFVKVNTPLSGSCTERESSNATCDIEAEKSNSIGIWKVHRDVGKKGDYRQVYISEERQNDSIFVEVNRDAEENNDDLCSELNKDEQSRGKITYEINRNVKKGHDSKGCILKRGENEGNVDVAGEGPKEVKECKGCERKTVVEENCDSIICGTKYDNNTKPVVVYRDEQSGKRNKTCTENREEEEGNDNIMRTIKSGANNGTDHSNLQMNADADKGNNNKNIENGSNTGKGNDNEIIEMDSGAEKGTDNEEKNRHILETNKLSTCKDKEPIYCLNFLTWSGSPYFFCKQSQFRFENMHNTTSNTKDSDAGSKRKARDTANGQPVQKKSKTEYREKNSEKTKRLHRVEDKFEPPTKRQRYRESDKKTTLHVSHKTSSDSSYKIRTQERMKQTTPISVEADIRKVRIKNTQSGSKSNTDKDETGNFDLRGLIKSKPTESSRTLIDYNDIEMF